MTELVELLRVALDQAEQDAGNAHDIGCHWFAEDGYCDCEVPAQRRALVERDRVLLDAYAVATIRTKVPWNASAAEYATRAATYSVLKAEIERAAEFWLEVDRG